MRQAVKTQLKQGGMKTEPPWHCAIARDAAGVARGYCIYFLSHSVHTDANALNHNHPTRNQMLTCRELIYSDMNAYRSLWSFLATKHDLVGNIMIAKVPGDDPAPTIFLEPRLLRTQATCFRERVGPSLGGPAELDRVSRDPCDFGLPSGLVRLPVLQRSPWIRQRV